jgi:uncharacterized protein
MDPFKTHGAISWPELQTSDQQGAVDFYGTVFGWDYDTMDMSDAGKYSVGKVSEIPACGIMTRVSEEMPPCWIFYVTVDDVDAIAQAAVQLGGSVFAEPMDIPNVGRMCGMADPQGAMIFAMQYSVSGGPAVDFADAFSTKGAFSWFQLMTPDPAAAAEFYGSLFGWTVEVQNMPMGEYRTLKLGEAGFGGMTVPPYGEIPAHWGAYVTVEDADALVGTVTEAGGAVMVPPMDIPEVGRFLALQDPQGAQIMAIAYVST